MEKVTVAFSPMAQTVAVPKGETVLRAAVLAGIAIDSVCGGKGTCGKCRVRAHGGLDEPGEAERAALSPGELGSGIRLACQAKILADAALILETPAPVSELAAARWKARPEKWRRPTLRPNVSKVCLPTAEFRQQPGASGFEHLRMALSQRGHRIAGADLEALRQLSEVWRVEADGITAVLTGSQMTAVEPGDTTQSLYGLAVDIGTSTVVGYLLDLRRGSQVAASGTGNPQAIHGQDVISRIHYAREYRHGRGDLQAEIVGAVNSIVGRVAEDSGVDRRSIYEMTVVGNTCMLHLLLGLNPVGLALAPYLAVTTQAATLTASTLGIEINPNGRVHILPSVAAFVGADTVGVVLATSLHRSPEIKLAIDIGTNGEMILGSRERLLCCSAAAGPAFEGGQIRQGIIAAPGAIERVTLDDEVSVTTIDGATPRGICGSGLIDALAEMLRYDVVDSRGRMVSPEAAQTLLPQGLARRVIRDEEGLHFVLVEGSEAFNGQPIAIYQKDVRQLQLAKAAVRAGVEILKKELGISDSAISEVLLAGAFGSYVNKENAAAIGLLPVVPLGRVRGVGNAAGMGAKWALLSTGARREAQLIARHAQYIELSARPDFQEHFMAAMDFPASAQSAP